MLGWWVLLVHCGHVLGLPHLAHVCLNKTKNISSLFDCPKPISNSLTLMRASIPTDSLAYLQALSTSSVLLYLSHPALSRTSHCPHDSGQRLVSMCTTQSV